jgi:D-alanyl-D-alanine dipeptidase
MKKIIYIADPEILAIPVIECYEPLVDIKDHTELQYGRPPECELTAECYTKMRQTVFDKLCQAQADLPHGWRFRIYEGFRSLTVQKILFDNQYERVSARYPDASHTERYHETTRLVSPVINIDGSPNIPPHNTGAAVDVEIITADNQLIDMGMAAKEWCTVENPDLCLTDSPLVKGIAKENRALLLKVMEAHGFVNYPTEWWHFSYGDRYWAYHRGIPAAIYGSLD